MLFLLSPSSSPTLCQQADSTCLPSFVSPKVCSPVVFTVNLWLLRSYGYVVHCYENSSTPSSRVSKASQCSTPRQIPMKYLIPVSATIQIPTDATDTSLLLTTPSYKALEDSTSIISLVPSVSVLERHRIQPSKLPKPAVSNIHLEKLRIAASTSIDLSTLPETYLQTLLSDYYSFPPTSLSSFPTISSHPSLTISLSEFPSPPSDDFWGSIDDVHLMITQLEQIAHDLRGFNHEDADATGPPYLDKSHSTLSALSLSSWTTSGSSDWLSSLHGSHPHSLAYLRDDRSLLEIEQLLFNEQAQQEPKVYIPSAPTEPTIPLIVVTLPSVDSLNKTEHIPEIDVNPQPTPKYVAPSLGPSKLKQAVSPNAVVSTIHLTPTLRLETRSRISRPRPLSAYAAPVQPAQWVCDIVSFPLGLHPWRRGEGRRSIRKKYSRKSSSPVWPAQAADRVAVKSFFEEDGGVDTQGGVVWYKFKQFFRRSKVSS